MFFAPLTMHQLGDRRTEHPLVALGVLDRQQALAGVSVPGHRHGVLALHQVDPRVGVVGLDVRRDLLVDVVAAGVECRLVGGRPVARRVLGPEVQAGQVAGRGQHRRVPLGLVLHRVDEVGPGLQVTLDHGRVVDEPGGSPVLADRVVVVRVPVLTPVLRVDVLEVGHPRQVHLLQQLLGHHQRDVDPGGTHDVVAALADPGRVELGDRLLVGVEEVDRDLRTLLGGELLPQLRVVVGRPVVDQQLALDRSGARRARRRCARRTTAAATATTGENDAAPGRRDAHARHEGATAHTLGRRLGGQDPNRVVLAHW